MDRLSYITSMLEGYNSVCDVGTDHGFVPINAIKNYNLKKAYALDINKGPLENAKKNISKNGLDDKIMTILSDGLKEFNYESDVIVIAGMGGALIKTIIENSLDKALNAKALILSANKEEEIVRKYLINNGFKITFEHILKDNNHFYEIIKVEPGKEEYNELDILYGPCLRKEKSLEFKEKWTQKLNVLKEAYKKCSSDKKDDLLIKIKSVEGVL